MSDRELLELAAKAAGLDGHFRELRSASRDHFRQIRYKSREAFVTKGLVWDPLNDDGDALRLAVKLDLSIITSWGFDGKPSGSVGAMLGSSEDLRLTNTKHNDDPCAAWRRTIVIAAAEIGKSWQENPDV
ncbi:hypothetical protein D3C76_1026660 [compost metagenome]